MFDRPRVSQTSESQDLLECPRVVVITRPSEYQLLLAQHGTREQARFFLTNRGQTIEPIQAAHEAFSRARHQVLGAIPISWRQASVERSDLHRFLFEPSDLVVAIGQDGLVANVAKYLNGQIVIGVDPTPGHNAGVLVRHRAEQTGKLLQAGARGRLRVAARTMVRVELDDGQSLVALNELFIGHPRHQSARYRISCPGGSERHSSSGVVVTTGTGATGWARSIARDRGEGLALPGPETPQLAFFVREAWPSPSTGTAITQGRIEPGQALELISELDEGVVFGDGIEADRLDFRWGVRASIRVAERRLRLAVG